MNYDIHTTEAHDRTVDDNKEKKDYTFFCDFLCCKPFLFFHAFLYVNEVMYLFNLIKKKKSNKNIWSIKV
jgi:hypothetical protein